MLKKKKNDEFISDSGTIHKHNVIDVIVICICALISAGVVYLGFMAYWVR